MKLNHEIQIISLEEIYPNKWNSNVMEKTMFKKLKNSIKSNGVLKPIIVYLNNNNEYIIIDGEHRFKALKEFKKKEAEVKVLSALDENNNIIPLTKELAMKLGIEANRISGEDDEEKLSDIFKVMIESYDINSLLETLPYSENEIYDLIELDVVEEEYEEPKETLIEDDLLNNVKLKIEFSEEEYNEIWLPAVNQYNFNNKTDASNREFIIGLCKGLLNTRKRTR